MSKKKFLKTLGCILLVIIVIILIHTVRNYIIITKLQTNISNYANSTNFYKATITTIEEGTKVTVKYYKKDNKQAVFINRDLNENKNQVAMYDNGDRVDIFIDSQESKVAKLNSGKIMSEGIYNQLENETKWQTFLGSILANVRKTNYNNKECYIIKNFLSTTSLEYEGAKIYVEKDTGLLIRTDEGDAVAEYEYDFDNVDDSIFAEPDISQYTLE